MRGPVFLTGMMGSGKTTVGRLLAAELDATFVDLDDRIETMFGRSIVDLFAESESRFRRLERLALTSLLEEPAFCARPVVVSTGGGVVLEPGNRNDMAACGTIAFIDVPVDELARRLVDQATPDRPLLADASSDLPHRLRELDAARRSAYLECSVCIDGRGEPEEVVARLLRALEPVAPDRDSQVG